MSSSSCNSLPLINNIQAKCNNGITSCKPGDTADVYGSLASLKGFANSYVKVEYCIFHMCTEATAAGQICTWVDEYVQWYNNKVDSSLQYQEEQEAQEQYENEVEDYNKAQEDGKTYYEYYFDKVYEQNAEAANEAEEAEEEGNNEQSPYLTCGQPGAYGLHYQVHIPENSAWGFTTLGHIKITNLAESHCYDESGNVTSYSMAGLASIALVGAAAYAAKKRRMKKQQQQSEEELYGELYVEMGSHSVAVV